MQHACSGLKSIMEVAHWPLLAKGKSKVFLWGFLFFLFFPGQTIGHGIYTYGKFN